MARSHKILIAILVFSSIAMTWFIASNYHTQPSDIALYFAFGVVIIATAIFGLRRKRPEPSSRPVVWRWTKYVVAAYALAGATWMLVSVVALPFVGYRGFLLLEKPWFGAGLLSLTLLLLPITRRYLR